MRSALYLLYICLFFFTTATFAQGENNHWHFGQGHHIDFNTNPPLYASNSNMSSYESCAAVSDAQGNLLFYTIGCRVWDRNGNEMPNATGLLGNGPIGLNGFGVGSSFEGVQVLPHPGSPDRYYIFSGSAFETGTNIIYYHVVDMSLNNGLGDVVPGEKNVVVLPQGCTEYTTTAMGDCNSLWFIAITSSGKYYAYKVDENGVNLTPVISTPNLTSPLGVFYTKITAEGIVYSTTSQSLMRCVFNRTTGLFSNYELLQGVSVQTFELSADNQKLYGAGFNLLAQWDLSLYPNIPAIAASAVDLVPVTPSLTYYTHLRLAPDGSIYVMRLQTVNNLAEFFVDRISQPNVLGPGAGYSSDVFNMPQTGSGIYLGAKFITLKSPDTIVNQNPLDTLICKDGPVTLKSPHDNMSYSWSNGTTAQETVVEAGGMYYVSSYTPDCKVYIDSFKVTYAHLSLELGNDTVLCAGDSYILDATQADTAVYSWNDGSTASQKVIDASGTYSVTISRNRCFVSDTVEVEVRSPFVRIAPNDTFICEQETLELSASSNFESQFSWSTGDRGNRITIDREGIYVVTASNVCGVQTDSVWVEQVICDCQPVMPTAFSPNGDGRNDVFLPLLQSACLTKSYELRVYNRYGQVVFSSNQPGVGWDGTYLNGRTAELGVYYYILKLESSYGNRPPVLAKGEVTLVR